jgi:asparagine synthase (glutamine-hydrolysing)
MHSASARFVIVFNGEIYNHQSLRAALAEFRNNSAIIWRGNSDTETLLEAIETWGVPETLRRAEGMFAFALWDCTQRKLILARDRFGEKPLYYGWAGSRFVFSSELKALRVLPDWQPEIDREAFATFVRHACVPAPHSIYRDIRKLFPGTFVTLDGNMPARTWPEPEAYWTVFDTIKAGSRDVLENDSVALNGLEQVLSSAIGRQMIADVPLGAFLSGGIDSSLIVAMMQAQSSIPVRTFSIGFSESDYDEAGHAKAVAKHLGTSHTEFYVSPGDALNVVPRLPDMFDEPFGDSSQIPTFLVAQLARQHVTVALSGDAGDELFGGYNRYIAGQKMLRRMRRVPASLKRIAATSLIATSPRLLDSLGRLLPRSMQVKAMGDKVHKLARVLDAKNSDDLYRRLTAQWPDSGALIAGEGHALPWPSQGLARATNGSAIERMMMLDQLGYLPDDILVKVDRAAMAVSLETRVPFLDPAVVNFSWRLPLHMKVRDGQGKWILRRLLDRHVPAQLIDRPKMGFGIPLDQWLRGPLRDWSETLLEEGRLRNEGWFDAKFVRARWAEHLSGKRNWQHGLWNVLMFQSWSERWL